MMFARLRSQALPSEESMLLIERVGSGYQSG